MERRISEYACPVCGTLLVERWEMRDTGTLAGGKEMQQIGMPICPDRHRFEWTLAGPA